MSEWAKLVDRLERLGLHRTIEQTETLDAARVAAAATEWRWEIDRTGTSLPQEMLLDAILRGEGPDGQKGTDGK